MKTFTLFCLLLVFAAPLKGQSLEKAKSVPFVLSDQGYILVKAKINNVEGTFIFDTGAGVNLLTKKFAAKANALEGGFPVHIHLIAQRVNQFFLNSGLSAICRSVKPKSTIIHSPLLI